jgi:hypothetical protein
METREPGQVRKEAALSGLLHVPRASLTGAETRLKRLGTGFEVGCTVRIYCPRASTAPGIPSRADQQPFA